MPGLNVGHMEVVIIAALFILLLSGPSRLPGAMKSIGRGLYEYKKVSNEIKDTFSLRSLLDEDHKRR